ncbi:MAG: hypothetical protein KGH67_01900 [Candidatus Micrarchaeota archaeon]|nr:hypothetical protein [Candidatus Micrarchaeota archaeon]MDE1859258.1 hypothetical protein [Candidatus Micrarchaeota archaeon]
MGNKGNNRHIKRLAAPMYLHAERKINKYLMKPNAGRHTGDQNASISTIITEKLNVAHNAKEAKRILNAGSVEVNGKPVKDPRYPVGFGDIIHFKPIKETFAVGVDRKGTIKVSKHEGKTDQVFKVIGKYIAKGNKEMIRLHDGTILPSQKQISVNDSVTLKNGKITSVIKLEKGAKCLVVKGIHASEEGTIADIKKGTALIDATVEIHGSKGNTETLLNNIMVIGAK